MLAIGLVLVAIVSVQLGSSFAKNLFPLIGPLATVFLRVTISAAIMLIVFRPWRVKISKDALKPLIGYGVSLGLMNCVFYLALQRIPLGICVALEFIGPLTVSVLSSKRRLDLLWVLFAGIGILLILPLKGSVDTLDPVGIILALLAGVGWGLYIIFGQRLTAKLDEKYAAAWGACVAALVTWPIALPAIEFTKFSGEVMSQALLVAVLASSLPYTLEMFALKRLTATTFGILMSLEPAMAALSGLIILRETLSGLQWAAIGAIIFASAGSALTAPKRRSEPL